MFHNKNAQNERIGMESTTVSTVSIVASAKSEKLAEKQSVFKGVWPLTEGDNWKNAFGVFVSLYKLYPCTINQVSYLPQNCISSSTLGYILFLLTLK